MFQTVFQGSGKKQESGLIQIQEEGRIRFSVHDVAVNTGKYRGPAENASLKNAWSRFGRTVHYLSDPSPDKELLQVFTEHNSFAEAVNIAFFHHYPLRITPDVLWITILQGVAIHVNEHSEELRKEFVEHEGKKQLVVERDHVPTRGEEWESAISSFSELIQGNVHPQVYPLIQTHFTTTTQIDQTVMNIAIMDMHKCYFEYVMLCGCGIPWIELLGHVSDWQLLLQKVESLRFLGLNEWLDALLEVLGYFERAARGDIGDGAFWRSVVFKAGGSGMIGDPLTGWLQTFFPYLQGDRGQFHLNRVLLSWKNDKVCSRNPSRSDGRAKGRHCDAVALKNIPSGISQAPVFIIDLLKDRKYDMVFAGGLTGVVRGSEGALEVTTGYAIIEK